MRSTTPVVLAILIALSAIVATGAFSALTLPASTGPHEQNTDGNSILQPQPSLPKFQQGNNRTCVHADC